METWLCQQVGPGNEGQYQQWSTHFALVYSALIDFSQISIVTLWNQQQKVWRTGSRDHSCSPRTWQISWETRNPLLGSRGTLHHWSRQLCKCWPLTSATMGHFPIYMAAPHSLSSCRPRRWGQFNSGVSVQFIYCNHHHADCWLVWPRDQWSLAPELEERRDGKCFHPGLKPTHCATSPCKAEVGQGSWGNHPSLPRHDSSRDRELQFPGKKLRSLKLLLTYNLWSTVVPTTEVSISIDHSKVVRAKTTIV